MSSPEPGPVDTEMHERREAALAGALEDDRMEGLLGSDVLGVAQALLGWLAEDGWVLVPLPELREVVADYRELAESWDDDHGEAAERRIRALVVGE